MTAHDTLRWGDQFAFSLLAGETATTLPTSQLVSAHWRRPLTWCVQLIMVPNFAAGEVNPFTIDYSITVGVGQSTISYRLSYDFTAAGQYAQIIDQKFIPAQDLQITAALTGNPSAPEAFLVAAMAAPFTEPGAAAELLDLMQGKPQQHTQWMPHGFHPEHLGYTR